MDLWQINPLLIDHRSMLHHYTFPLPVDHRSMLHHYTSPANWPYIHATLLYHIIRSFICNMKRPSVKQSIKWQVCSNFQMKCPDKMYPSSKIGWHVQTVELGQVFRWSVQVGQLVRWSVQIYPPKYDDGYRWQN